MYKLFKDEFGNINPTLILRTTDNVYIPFDPANTSYQEYLEWVAEGNEPEPADEA